jgi:hypothetical protein
VIAEIRKTSRADIRLADPRAKGRESRRVIEFPVFERYRDDIDQWISELGGENPGRRTAARVARSLRNTAESLDRVRFSARHSSLALFLRHAANSLEAGELDGARYILMTATCAMSARAVTGGFQDIFGHFPETEEAAIVELPVAATGIAIG